eukprot:1256475-Rhodomonas_salina.2
MWSADRGRRGCEQSPVHQECGAHDARCTLSWAWWGLVWLGKRNARLLSRVSDREQTSFFRIFLLGFSTLVSLRLVEAFPFKTKRRVEKLDSLPAQLGLSLHCICPLEPHPRTNPAPIGESKTAV